MIKLREAKRHVELWNWRWWRWQIIIVYWGWLAVSAKTLIASRQTLCWISMKGDSRDTLLSSLWRMLSRKFKLNCCYTTTTNHQQLLKHEGQVDVERWDDVFLSLLSNWRWDESAAVVVKMIWPRYEPSGCICRSLSKLHAQVPALLTGNIEHYNNSSVEWQPRPAKWRQKQDPSRYQVAEGAVICQE